MNPEKQARLKATGFRVGDAEDFLELTQEEREIVDRRVVGKLVNENMREEDLGDPLLESYQRYRR